MSLFSKTIDFLRLPRVCPGRTGPGPNTLQKVPGKIFFWSSITFFPLPIEGEPSRNSGPASSVGRPLESMSNNRTTTTTLSHQSPPGAIDVPISAERKRKSFFGTVRGLWNPKPAAQYCVLRILQRVTKEYVRLVLLERRRRRR